MPLRKNTIKQRRLSKNISKGELYEIDKACNITYCFENSASPKQRIIFIFTFIRTVAFDIGIKH